MSCKTQQSPAHAMDLAWGEWHSEVPDKEIPMVSRSFSRAWMAQQAKIDDQARKMRVMHFAVRSALQVLKSGTPEQINEAAEFLSVIKRITEN